MFDLSLAGTPYSFLLPHRCLFLGKVQSLQITIKKVKTFHPTSKHTPLSHPSIKKEWKQLPASEILSWAKLSKHLPK